MSLSSQTLKQAIKKYYDETPENVHGVAYGYKKVGGERTATLSIVFSVVKKKPREELQPNEFIPDHIMIDGERVLTDVQETPTAVPLNACYNVRDTMQMSAEIARLRGIPAALVPMRGGQQINKFPVGWDIYNRFVSAGTLGFFAIDNTDERIVGVTNTHVVIPNYYYAGDPRRFNVDATAPIVSANFDDLGSYPTYLPAVYPEAYTPINTIEPQFWAHDGLKYPLGALIPDGASGMTYHHAVRYVKRYVPYSSENNNYADAALLIMNNQRHLPSGNHFVDANSYEIQVPAGVDALGHLPFATTNEINDLLTSLPPGETLRVYSTGRTTGPKGYCDSADSHLILVSIHQIVNLAGDYPASFIDCLAFELRSPSALSFAALNGGDSGSAVLADIVTPEGSVARKIIGIAFAGPSDGSGLVGFACRIDKVAEALNIRAWDADYTFNRATSLSIPTPVLATRPLATDGKVLSLTLPAGLYWHAGVTSRLDISQSPPTAITTVPAAPAVIPDTIAGGALVYVFDTDDTDILDTFTYTLVPGIGDDDNESFYIAANQLRVNLAVGESFDAQIKDDYSVRVRSTDSAGAFVEQVFAIQIVPAPKHPPTDILLSNASIEANNAVGDTIGTFSTVDADGAIDSFTYDLVAGEGDTDNNEFEIVGDTLRALNIFTPTTLSIRVRVTDSTDRTTAKAFTITITPVPLAPNFTFATTSITNSASLNLYGGADDHVGTFTTTFIDPDSSSADIVYSLVLGDFSRHNALFEISGTQLRTKNNLTFAALDAGESAIFVYIDVRVRCTDTRTGKYTEYDLAGNFFIYAAAPSAPVPLLTSNTPETYLYAGLAAEVGVLSATVDGAPLTTADSSYALVPYTPDSFYSQHNTLFSVGQRPDGTWILRTVNNLLYSQSSSGTFYCVIQATHVASGATGLLQLFIQSPYPGQINPAYVKLEYNALLYSLGGQIPVAESTPGVVDAAAFAATFSDEHEDYGVKLYGELTFELVNSDDAPANSNSLFAITSAPLPTLQNTVALTGGANYYLYLRISNTNVNMTDIELQSPQFSALSIFVSVSELE